MSASKYVSPPKPLERKECPRHSHKVLQLIVAWNAVSRPTVGNECRPGYVKGTRAFEEVVDIPRGDLWWWIEES